MRHAPDAPLRVGLVGVTGGGQDWRNASWAHVAHLPALRALDGYDLRAITSRNPASAAVAAEEFGVAACYRSVDALAAADDVDLIVVTVRVPAHYDVVMTALAHGKRVFCEWPLGNGVKQAEEMAAAAQALNLCCGVGLQARASPVIRYVRDLVAQGFVGNVLSTTMVGAGMNWGPGMPLRNDYTLDKTNGATLLTIVVGHAIDALEHCLGRIVEVQAMSALRRSTMNFKREQLQLAVTAEDQWLIAARLATGAVASIHFRGGMVAGDNLRWEINGTRGDLMITCPFGNIQPFSLSLSGAQNGGDLKPMPVPARYLVVPDLPDPVLNVAQQYMLFATASPECATFDDGLHVHRLLHAIERSAETAQLIRVAEQPVSSGRARASESATY